jgi:hypothetical protein
MTASRDQASKPTARLADDGKPNNLDETEQQVWRDVEAGTLRPHEWLFMTAEGTAAEQMMLIAAIALCRGATPESMTAVQDENPDDLSRLIPGAMRWLQRERPGYVAEIGRILADVESRWDEIGPLLKKPVLPDPR